ncbi:WD40-repeat-containing domain protein [Pisolithus thermaeus]|nr:WD40-repeat-containing domain protein [Pisolithus croceorrhizus]KAI6162492.1 WD40-repeat-containing domain protein [Pisolithus thermaeus]
MLSTPYIQDKCLRGHTDTVNCLAFSPHIDYLASGSDDCSLIIWRVTSGEVVCTIRTPAPTLSVLWDPRRRLTVIFGCNNGVAAVLSDFQDPNSAQAILLGVKAPVYCLDLDASSGKLTIGVGPEIHIAQPIAHRRYASFDILAMPPELRSTSTSEGADDEYLVRARSLHFLRGGNKLVASYLNHGIVGFSALSPDQRGLLVSNLSTGADLYRLGQSALIQTYPQRPPVERNYPLVVSFLHKGNAVICGASHGDVFIRDTWTGEHQQTLEHDDDFVQVLCTGQYRQMGYIATATAEMGLNTYIKIWKARLDPSISNSIASAILTSTAFFYYADFREEWRVLRAYGAFIFPVLAVLGYYLWHIDDAACLLTVLRGILRMIWHLILQWLRDLMSSLWAKCLASLRVRLKQWLAD